MTQSIFIASETKPGKSKITSLLKAVGFVERTATPLWSYTYTRLRVDQVDFRDDYYEDSDWLYDTDFDTKWAIRVSLHATHKPHHKALWKSLSLIIAQIYDVQTVFLNQSGTDVPGEEINAEIIVDGDVTEIKNEPSTNPKISEQSDQPSDAVREEDAVAPLRGIDFPSDLGVRTVEDTPTDDDFYPETEVRLVSVEPEQIEEDSDDDWADEWDDDIEYDEDESEEELDEDDPWSEEEDEEEESSDDEDFDGIVTWD